MKSCSPVAILIALSLLGCKGNSSCTIGNQSCYENQALLCIGPDQGGDADGEFKTIDDCKAQGKVCIEDVWHLKNRLAGCTTQACASTTESKCITPGQTTCVLDKYVFTCIERTDGCRVYTTSQDCSTIGKTCAEDANQGAICSP